MSEPLSLLSFMASVILLLAPLVVSLSEGHGAGSEGFFDDVKNFFDPPKPPPPPPPCFSEASTLARSDCQTTRLKNLQDKVYPLFLTNFKWATNVSAVAKGAIATGNQQSVNVSRIISSVSGGPQGFIQQTSMLTKGSQELGNITDKASNQMWRQASTLQTSSTKDLSSFKSSLGSGIGNLLDNVDRAKTTQANLSSIYKGIATQYGQAELTTISSNLNTDQSQVVGGISNSTNLLANTTSTAKSRQALASKLLNRLVNTVTASPAKLKNTVSSAAQSVAGMIESSQSNLDSTAQMTLDSVSSQAEAAGASFESASGSAIEVAGGEWESAEESESASIGVSFEQSSETLASEEGAVASSVASSSSGIAKHTRDIQAKVGSSLDHLTHSAASLKDKSSTVSSELGSLSSSVNSSASSAGDSSNKQSSAIKVQMKNMLGSAQSATAEQASSLFKSLGDVQTSAQSQIGDSRRQMSSQVGQFYSEIGGASSSTADSVNSAQSLLLDSKNQVAATARHQAYLAMTAGSTSASTILDLMMSLSGSMGDSSTAAAAKAGGAADAKSSSVKDLISSLLKNTDSADSSTSETAGESTDTLSKQTSLLLSALASSGQSSSQIQAALQAMLASQSNTDGLVASSSGNAQALFAALAQTIGDESDSSAEGLSGFAAAAKGLIGDVSSKASAEGLAKLQQLWADAIAALEKTGASEDRTAKSTEEFQAETASNLTSLRSQLSAVEEYFDDMKERLSGRMTGFNTGFADLLQQQSAATDQEADGFIGGAGDRQLAYQKRMQNYLSSNTASFFDEYNQLGENQKAYAAAAQGQFTSLNNALHVLGLAATQFRTLMSQVTAELGGTQAEMLDDYNKQVSSINGKILDLRQHVYAFETEASLQLNRSATQIQTAASNIPGMFSVGAAETNRVINEGNAALKAEMNALNVSIAMSGEGDASDGGEILDRIRQVQTEARAADNELREKVRESAILDNIQMRTIRGMASNFASTVGLLGNDAVFSASSLKIQADSLQQQINATFADLNATLDFMVASANDKTTDMITDSRFNVSILKMRNDNRLNGTHAMLQTAEELLVSNRQRVADAEASLRRNVTQLQKEIAIVNSTLIAGVQRIYNLLSSAKKTTKSAVLDEVGMADSVDAWSNLADELGGRIIRFKNVTAENVSAYEGEVRQRLALAEERLNQAKMNRDAADKSQVELDDAESDMEDVITGELLGVIDRQREAVRLREQMIGQARGDLEAFEREAIEKDDELRATVKEAMLNYETLSSAN